MPMGDWSLLPRRQKHSRRQFGKMASGTFYFAQQETRGTEQVPACGELFASTTCFSARGELSRKLISSSSATTRPNRGDEGLEKSWRKIYPSRPSHQQ